MFLPLVRAGKGVGEAPWQWEPVWEGGHSPAWGPGTTSGEGGENHRAQGRSSHLLQLRFFMALLYSPDKVSGSPQDGFQFVPVSPSVLCG